MVSCGIVSQGSSGRALEAWHQQLFGFEGEGFGGRILSAGFLALALAITHSVASNESGERERYRGTSRVSKCTHPGPYSRPTPRSLSWS